jgi:undecaprenyl pyrophosphate phosphatase UppP
VVDGLLSALGLTPALGAVPVPGTSDEQTARWLSRSMSQLLVVPFHFHRGADRSRLDGIGALRMDAHEITLLAIGFVVSFLVAWGVVAWFMNWVRNRGFAIFAIYRILFGIAVLLWM